MELVHFSRSKFQGLILRLLVDVQSVTPEEVLLAELLVVGAQVEGLLEARSRLRYVASAHMCPAQGLQCLVPVLPRRDGRLPRLDRRVPFVQGDQRLEERVKT